MLKRCVFLVVSVALMLSLIACAKQSPEKVTQPSVSSSIIEVANFNLSELIELQKVVGEVLSHAKTVADENQKRLVNQAEALLGAIQPDSKLRDIVTEKTEEQRLILDFLKGIFAIGAEYFYKIPSPVAGAIAKSAEELGNQIAEWQVLGQLSFARITQPDTGVMEVVYYKHLGEVWASFDISNPVGRVCIYIPVRPALVSPAGGGNILLSEGVRPILENSKVAYRFGTPSIPTSTPAALPLTPSQTQKTPAEPRVEAQYIDLTPGQIYALVISSSSLTELQREQNWNKLKGKLVRWSGDVQDVLSNNTVVVHQSFQGSFLAVVNFKPSWSNQLAQLAKDQRIFYSARLVKIMKLGDSDYSGYHLNIFAWGLGLALDQGELTASPIPAPIQGTYIETPEAKGKVIVVSHSWVGNKYLLQSSPGPGVNVQIKNILVDDTPGIFGGGDLENMELIVTFKDASGNECNLFGEEPISYGTETYTKGTWRKPLYMRAGETQTYVSVYLGSGIFPLSELDKLASYEITIVKGGKP